MQPAIRFSLVWLLPVGMAGCLVEFPAYQGVSEAGPPGDALLGHSGEPDRPATPPTVGANPIPGSQPRADATGDATLPPPPADAAQPPAPDVPTGLRPCERLCTGCGPNGEEVPLDTDEHCRLTQNCSDMAQYRILNDVVTGDTTCELFDAESGAECAGLGICANIDIACHVSDQSRLLARAAECELIVNCGPNMNPEVTDQPAGVRCGDAGARTVCDGEGHCLGRPNCHDIPAASHVTFCHGTPETAIPVCRFQIDNPTRQGAQLGVVSCAGYCGSGDLRCLNAWDQNGYHYCEPADLQPLGCDAATGIIICDCASPIPPEQVNPGP